MSEYIPITPIEEVTPYLRRVFLAKMEPRSAPWWAMQSVIERVDHGSPESARFQREINALESKIAELEDEICVLKNPTGQETHE